MHVDIPIYGYFLVGAEGEEEREREREREGTRFSLVGRGKSVKFQRRLQNVTLARNCTADTGSTVCEIFCYLSPPFLGGTLSFRSSRTRPYSSPESPASSLDWKKAK